MKRLRLLPCLITISMSFFTFTHCEEAPDKSVEGTAKEILGKKVPQAKIIFKTVESQKQEQLEALEEERAKVEKEKETAVKNITTEIEELKNKRLSAQTLLERDPQDEFLIKKISLITQTLDMLNDVQRSWENYVKKLSDHVQALKIYLNDIDFKEYKKNLKITSGPYFFEDLEDIYQKVMSQQKFLDALKKQRESVIKEQKSVNQQLEKADEEYKAKQEELGKITASSSPAGMPFGLSIEQRAELLNLEVNAAKLKKDLTDLQAKEKKNDLSLLDTKLLIENLQYDILQDYQSTIKSSITVTPEQIESAHQELEKKKQSFSIIKTRYSDEIVKLRRMRVEEENKLAQASKQYGITLGNDLDNWALQPKKTIESYVGLCRTGSLNTYVRLLEDKEKFFEALIGLEQEKIAYAEQIVKIKETYYKVSARKFINEDEISTEIKNYTDTSTVYETALKSLKAKKDDVEAVVLKLQNEVVDNLKKRKVDIQQQKDSLFKNSLKEFVQCLTDIEKAEDYLAQRIDIVAGTGKSYAETIGILERETNYNRFILTELESITIWYRPEYAITSHGISNVGHDFRLYASELFAYIKQFEPSMFFDRIKDVAKTPWQFLKFLGELLMIALTFFILSRYKLPLIIKFHSLSQRYPFFKEFFLIVELIVGFLGSYAFLSAFWLMSMVFVRHYMQPDPFMYSLFYLFSIPYLLYIAYKFIQYLITFNKNYAYCFVSQEFMPRFIGLFSTLLCGSIVLLFLRKSFTLIKIPKTELPDIFLALAVIIVQVCLILLVSKEQILSLIPTRYEFWQWIYKIIDRYYYIMIALLIMVAVLSNPYVGYGRLVLHILENLVYTGILIKLLMWGHSLVKKVASQIFFYTQDEVAKERFVYAKTWFGIAIILSFLLFGILGLFIGGKIWGWPLTFKDIYSWLNVPIFGIGKGTTSPLTLITIGTILLFIIFGFCIAFAFNKFVLEKIFDLMLVETGVQHAVTNLVRYICVAVAIVLAFQSVGYGGFLTYIYVLVLGIGYLIQNPLNDLVSYFILLMQRPIKIGDFIQLDEDTFGVVRKITPKSVMLRRRNSTTIVIPNAQITNKMVVNWNYARNFIAFNDILISVSYKSDPARVKELLMQAVESHPNVLKNPKPVIRLENFNEQGFQFMVRGFISSNYTLEMWDIASDVRLSIVKILRDNGIDIAVPVRVVLSSSERSSNYRPDIEKENPPTR